MLYQPFHKIFSRNPKLHTGDINALMRNMRALIKSGGIDCIVGPAGIHQRRKLTAIGTYEAPHEISPTPEGTETADTGTWERTSPPAGKDGVSLKVHTRTVYNDAGDEKLYGFYRTLTFDSLGSLATISLETRYIIDTPTACP